MNSCKFIKFFKLRHSGTSKKPLPGDVNNLLTKQHQIVNFKKPSFFEPAGCVTFILVK